MKTNCNQKPKRTRGFIVIALLTILGMMSLYVATNLRTLALLKRELQIIDQKQIQHWRR